MHVQTAEARIFSAGHLFGASDLGILGILKSGSIILHDVERL